MSEKTQREIARVCDGIKNLLLEKNRKYGDSALEPVRVMSAATPVEQILVRIDDKLSRISRGAGLLGDDEDVIQDLIGYFVLLKIALNRQAEETIRESASDYDAFIALDYDAIRAAEPVDLGTYGTDSIDLNIDECGWDPSSGPTC